MKFTLKDLDWQLIPTSSLVKREMCWQERWKGDTKRHRISFANVLYYLGGLIVIGAMTFYATMAWGDLGGIGHALMGLFYSAIFLFAGNRLWKTRASAFRAAS